MMIDEDEDVEFLKRHGIEVEEVPVEGSLSPEMLNILDRQIVMDLEYQKRTMNSNGNCSIITKS
jgi:hypothetical protein